MGTTSALEKFISIHTLRMEGDTQNICCFLFVRLISIHTLRMEGDVSFSYNLHTDFENFNPHPPHGG